MIHLAVLSVRSGSAESFRLVSCALRWKRSMEQWIQVLIRPLQAAGASLRAATVDDACWPFASILQPLAHLWRFALLKPPRAPARDPRPETPQPVRRLARGRLRPALAHRRSASNRGLPEVGLRTKRRDPSLDPRD